MTRLPAKVIAKLAKNLILPTSFEAAKHDYLEVFAKCKEDLSRLMDTDLADSKVLVIGCGYNYPDLVLWSSVCRLVVGVDLRSTFWKNRVLGSIKNERKDLRRVAASLMRGIYEWRSYHGYYPHLRNLTNLALDEHHQDLISYDGVRLPFVDGAFDVVMSNAVLEHVDDLEGLIGETSRVTRTSGLSYHLWHNYLSLSGGHLPDDLAELHPWGHLLGDPLFETYTGLTGASLNRFHPERIKESLSRSFEPIHVYGVDKHHNKKGVDSDFELEGSAILTRELEQKLSQYPKELLQTRSVLFIGRK
jgi:SAM-dependent methyltransferase